MMYVIFIVQPELIDKIATNPAMMNVIAAQHRERHLAAKRMKMVQDVISCLCFIF